MSILESRAVSTESLQLRRVGVLMKAWSFARLLLNVRFARKIGTLATTGYLHETGWVRSVLQPAGEVDLRRPLPWATFPYIAFIERRLQPTMRVFEFGAGASTLYYAPRVAEVVAVEHDADFLAKLQPALPRNVRVQLEPENSDEYLQVIATTGCQFDLVVVDGRDRVRCVSAALLHLAPTGAVVLDDAERPEYAPAIEQLKACGFRQLEFWGLPPGGVETKSTSIFYRRDNCFGL